MVMDLFALMLLSIPSWNPGNASPFADFCARAPHLTGAPWLAQDATNGQPPSTTPSVPKAAPAAQPDAGLTHSPGSPPNLSEIGDAPDIGAADFSPIKLTLGSGVIYAIDGIKKYVQKGESYTLGFSYPYQATDDLNSYLGIVYNYGKYAQKLSALDDQGNAATFRLVEFDLAAIMGFEYYLRDNLALVYEFGPALQQRAMWINAGLNGIDNDNYAAFGLGLVAKVAAEYHLDVVGRMLLGRLSFTMTTGTQMLSTKLKYSHTQVDINATQCGLGIEIGYAF